MATLKEQLARANSIKSNKIEDDIIAFVRSLEPELVQLEKNRLFNESKDILGNAIGFYSKATEILSKGAKKEGQPFTAKDTGDFFKGFYMHEGGGIFNFYSSDSKTTAILRSDNWLSDEIFGLSDKDLRLVIQTQILPFIQSSIKNQLSL